VKFLGARLTVLALTPLAVAAGQGKAGAGKPCSLIFTEVKTADTLLKTHTNLVKTGTGQYMTYYGGGVDARCEGTDQRVLADSAEHSGDEKRLFLIGHVHYTESRVTLDSDRMTYWTNDERLLAEGNVVGVTKTGTHFTGPSADYLRPAPGVRSRSHLTADGRPNLWLSAKDMGGDTSTAAKDSTHVIAQRIVSDNDSLVYASGNVFVDRTDITATSDSAFLDNGREFSRLMGTPKIVGHGEKRYTLEGTVIDLQSRQRQIERVKARGKGVATSEDVVLTADTIDLRVTKQKLQRAYAFGPGIAKAHSEARDLFADSIDVVIPDQVLREMRATRHARAESKPDSAKIVSKEKDWLAGNTIVAFFDPPAKTDTVNQPAIRQIVATDAAQSYYQLSPGGEKVKNGKPNINYVTGRLITVDFHDRQVESVSVQDQATGWYVEAAPDSTSVKVSPDSSGAKSKSGVKADSTAPPKPKKPAPLFEALLNQGTEP
jgi:lipopolysaccharide export system protein LptA